MPIMNWPPYDIAGRIDQRDMRDISGGASPTQPMTEADRFMLGVAGAFPGMGIPTGITRFAHEQNMPMVTGPIAPQMGYGATAHGNTTSAMREAETQSQMRDDISSNPDIFGGPQKPGLFGGMLSGPSIGRSLVNAGISAMLPAGARPAASIGRQVLGQVFGGRQAPPGMSVPQMNQRAEMIGRMHAPGGSSNMGVAPPPQGVVNPPALPGAPATGNYNPNAISPADRQRIADIAQQDIANNPGVFGGGSDLGGGYAVDNRAPTNPGMFGRPDPFGGQSNLGISFGGRFKDGGMVPGRPGEAKMIMAHAGEGVVPEHVARMMPPGFFEALGALGGLGRA